MELRWNGRCPHGCKTMVSLLGKTVYVAGKDFVRDLAEGGARYRVYRGTLAIPCKVCPPDTGAFLPGEKPIPHYITLKSVHGVVKAEIPCTAKCFGATGHDCMCECGGRNHGAGHG